ncbi:MAG: alpha/beta hydrolase [Flavobacteriales bacterium]|nr:alpha/beta hydrolase [Flavobacteriales bacterium]
MGILKEMERHGAYAQLSNGKVRYEFAGPENGEVVVLIHGLIGHMHVWDNQFHFLIAQGYRVLRFDLYGRGFSERVKHEHGSELFMAQVADLIEFVGLKEKFHLVGLSMGGAISTRFASHHPEKIKSIFLVDCYGIPTPNDPGIRIMQPKGIGEALIGTLGGPILKRAPIKGVFDKKKHGDFAKWFAAPMVIKGSKRALLSTLRNFMLENHVPHYERLNHLNFPKLILWGREDAILPFSYGQKIHALVPNARFETFEKCGHVPQFEEPEKFNQLALQFLTSGF